jgi:hypothetical protein
MPELLDARHLIEGAEQAAGSGDFSSADELLREAARIQEAELGPVHPDLANTLNNLAIVAEKLGRPDDAETFYRRAAAIASASLPADHPMVAESRKNLEDFCREHGLAIAEAAVMTASAPDPAIELDAPTEAIARPASQPLPPAPRRSSRPLAWAAIGAVALLVVAVLVTRPWSSSQPSTAAPPTTAVEPAVPPVVAPAPIERARPPDAAPPASRSPAPGAAVSLAFAQLCQPFSTSSGRWQCDSPGDAVAPGRVVLYTRVKSSSDATIVHRWYRDDVLRQSVNLTVRANASAGFRTYSRQTVDVGGNWRVEVRDANGALLHQERFAVR